MNIAITATAPGIRILTGFLFSFFFNSFTKSATYYYFITAPPSSPLVVVVVVAEAELGQAISMYWFYTQYLLYSRCGIGLLILL